MQHNPISRITPLLITIVFCLSFTGSCSEAQAQSDFRKLIPQFISESGCPIQLIGAMTELELDPSGTPVAARHYVDYRNYSNRPIAAVRFRIGYSDVSGSMYRPFLNGDDKRVLQPGEQASARFRGDKVHPDTIGVKLRVLEVTFADGQVWQSVKLTKASNKQESDYAPLVLENRGSQVNNIVAPSNHAPSYEATNNSQGTNQTTTPLVPQTQTPRPVDVPRLTPNPQAENPPLLEKPLTAPEPAEMPLNEPPGKTTLEEKILQFAQSKIGMQVGSGECGDLGTEAVKTAGAKPPTYDARSDEWSWGTQVKDPRDAQPGDIIQFHNAHFDFYKQRDEGAKHITQHTTQISPQHTSIISQNLGNGKFLILDQHVDGRKTVKERELDLTAQTQGSVKIYRPQESPIVPLRLVPQVYHPEKRPAVLQSAPTRI